jgi:membrane protein CcdC involved in cytochrome C biogenesis
VPEETSDQPSWAPWAYVGTGIIGLLVVAFAFMSGQAGLIEAIILGVSFAVIFVGVKQLRERRTRGS